MNYFLRFTIACCIILLGLLSNTYAVVLANEVEEEVISQEIHVKFNIDTTETNDAEETVDHEELQEVEFPKVEILEAESPLFEQITETAHKLKGVKYRYAGTSPTTGFDCSGFTTYVFAQHGISLPRSSGDMYTLGEEVKRSELQAGDLVFFKTSGNKISHVGIYIGDNQFIHSSTSHGVITTNLNDPYYWSQRYVGAKRIL